MTHRPSRLNAPLRLGIAAVVAVAWMLGVIACCPVSPPAASAAPVAGSGHAHHAVAGHAQHAVGGHAQHGDTGAGRGGVISRACPHGCPHLSTPAMHAGQAVDLLAPTVVAATAVPAAPFAGPVVAGTRDPPVPIEAVHDHLGRNILTRICICRR